MDSFKTDAHDAQAPASNISRRHRPWRIPRQRNPVPFEMLPRQIARKKHRIRIARAVNLIARTRCPTTVACRAVGLHTVADMCEVRAACDAAGIPRRHSWGTPLAVPHTLDCPSAYVEPRPPDARRCRTSTKFTPLRPGIEWQVLDEFAEPRTGTEVMAGTSTDSK
jgi:hypothetical protein